jgi:hypothetical protein
MSRVPDWLWSPIGQPSINALELACAYWHRNADYVVDRRFTAGTLGSLLEAGSLPLKAAGVAAGV